MKVPKLIKFILNLYILFVRITKRLKKAPQMFRWRSLTRMNIEDNEKERVYCEQ